MTAFDIIDSTSSTAVVAKHLGLVPGAEQLIVAAAIELAELRHVLPESTCEVLRGFMVMAMLADPAQVC